MRVERTRQADKDLIAVYLYGYDKFGEEQAEHYYAKLAETFRLLADNPLIGREHSEYRPPVRIHHHRRHLIIYTVADDSILILRVLSDRVDLARHL